MSAAPAYNPTSEQLLALDVFKTGANLAIEAGAGTGKTSTLVLLAASTGRQGQYLAFNKAIVEEAKMKFPRNVACNTAHSLAYRAIVSPSPDFAERLRGSERMKSWDIASVLGIDAIRVTTYANEAKRLGEGFLAGLVMRSVTRFCQTADEEPSWRHVPYIPALDAPSGFDKPENLAVNREVARALEPAVKKAWADMTTYRGSLPFKHDAYLKMWQLSDPRISADFILFDEAQDANGVLLSVVHAQSHAQRVYVGDSQQSIYGFTGALNALERIKELGGETTFLTQSFRFGNPIAAVANDVLADLRAQLRIRGFDQITSTVTPVDEPDAILTRTNAEAVRCLFDAIQRGLKAHLVGGGSEIASFARAAIALQKGRRTEHPELACFSSWKEVLQYVETDQQGDELRLLVNLIEEFGAQMIIDALDATTSESAADLVISTAHKSKGREWNRVRLGSDFPEPEKMGPEEKRLLYVAVTRAKLELDITGVAYFRAPSACPCGRNEMAGCAECDKSLESAEREEVAAG